MSLIYNRVGQLKRQPHHTGAGPQGYGGSRVADEVAVGLPFACSVQAKGSGRLAEAGLASDTPRAEWVVMVPRSVVRAMAPETFQNKDLIYDDLGRRFRITSDFVDVMGAALTCAREET